MKKIATAAAIILLLGSSLSVFVYFRYLQKPSVKFLLHMTGITKPRFVKKESITITWANRDISVIRYFNTRLSSNINYMMIHGVTPQGNNHPQMHLISQAITDVTGMNMLVPSITGLEGEKEMSEAIRDISLVYEGLHARIPGDYRAFGVCLAASGLMVALNSVPPEIYPKKVFLIGPFLEGKQLVDFYNSNKMEVDFFVKMAISMKSDHFSEKEKILISRAIRASEPGPTDTAAMKKILGQKLFNDMVIMDLHNKGLENIDGNMMFKSGKKIPDCKYFILHASNDRIIPQVQGRRFNEFLKLSGARTSFLGTELFEHTQNTVTVTGFIKEVKYLINFFDELFEGDVAK
ncbi:MAG TPA: hypothetical protein PK573_08095 [Spirochaetota bacterium]|nr:hypothetical protein [Spirochaetota bacterium]HRZ28253.1 hypothetical protein [Spirochaetota bacterium]HSA13349.1 hypothetical protein [Spirochaetota bacterium]